MKKFISFILILVMLMAMSTTAAATEVTEPGSGNSQEIWAIYKEGVKDNSIISVNISWEKMSFTYKGESEPVWNANLHQYEGEATEAGWAPSEAKITITNNSNTILKATFAYQHKDAFKDIDMAFTDMTPYIGSADTNDSQDAEGNPKGTPCQVSVKVIPTGVLEKENVESVQIGTITVSIEPVADCNEVVAAIEALIKTYQNQENEQLTRSDVHFREGTDVNALTMLMDAVWDATTTAETNVALNKLITTFYGALEIIE